MTIKPFRQQGFSLLELMIVIVVMAILLAIAVPSFRETMQRSQVGSATNELLASFDYARSEAISRGQMVSMCPSTTGTSCAGGTTLETGWMIYTYPAGATSANKAYDASTGILLRTITARTGVSVRGKSATVVTFGLQGQQLSPTSPPPALAYITCFRSSGTGVGTSTTKVPGVQVNLNGSGSATSQTLTSGASCTPS
jgi:type IV fimbrial biogenesis protein FimT